MANVAVTIDVRSAVAALGAVSGPALHAKLGAVVREAALFGERTVVGFTPVRTGALRASIHASRVDQLGWKVATPLGYAPAVEDGSKPHTIVPRRGKLLRFAAGGSIVYARRVRHPGTKARRMFARSVPIVVGQLPQIVARHLGARP